MRSIILIFFSLFSFSALGQLKKVIPADEVKQFDYSYKFEIKDSAGGNSNISIERNPSSGRTHSFKGTIMDYKKQPIAFATILLKNKDNSFYTMADENGQFEIVASPGIYELSCSAVNYASLSESIKIDEEYDYILKIQLRSSLSHAIYNIYSKRKLTNQEIEGIKSCVIQNRDNPNKCRKNEYYILIEI